MCLAAILWANIDKIYYGCTLKDNEEIGFRDVKLDQIISKKSNLDANLLEQKDHELCKELFDEYKKMNKTIY